MKIKKLHNWNIAPKEAIELQKSLAGQVQVRRFNKKLKTIGGLDCAFTPSTSSGHRDDKKNIIACVVVMSAKTFEIIETSYTVQVVNFPYIPGLLSFREAPACLAAIEKLTSTSPLMDKGEIIGSVVRTRSNVKPVFVSIGNRCRLCDAVRIVLDCCKKYRLPEPSRLAHQIVTKLKKTAS
ncbi:MAG: endonuclease V [Phycisphaerae bacterium]|nr:endonuclease V [Phycisphaerae bacterium]